MGNKENREAQLGMTIGTATSRLRKMVLFRMVQKSGMDACHRCGETISSVDDLSIEHKVPWLHSEDPVRLFFDIDNIAFSHYICNVSANRGPSPRLSDEEKKQKRREWEYKYRRTDGYKKYNREYQNHKYHTDENYAAYLKDYSKRRWREGR